MHAMRTILIVDDNADARAVFSALLSHNGYRVAAAENGAIGLARALELMPDLILMDIAMPVMNGIEAARRLRADDRTAAIPLLAVTANLFSQKDRAELAHLFNGYVAKPLSAVQLTAAVERLLDQPEPLTPP